MKISHLIYKADDLQKAVSAFEDMGFKIEYGKKDDPYNALIYFEDHTYIEIMQNIHISKVVGFLLKLFGMRGYLESSLAQNDLPEGFFRFALLMEPSDKKELAGRYKKYLNVSSFFAPVSRTDIHGHKLKCKCLMPSDCNYPFFNTEFQCEELWQITHPNGIKGIKEVIFDASAGERTFFLGLPVDERLTIKAEGNGIRCVEFECSDGKTAKLIKQEGKWIFKNKE